MYGCASVCVFVCRCGRLWLSLSKYLRKEVYLYIGQEVYLYLGRRWEEGEWRLRLYRVFLTGEHTFYSKVIHAHTRTHAYTHALQHTLSHTHTHTHLHSDSGVSDSIRSSYLTALKLVFLDREVGAKIQKAAPGLVRESALALQPLLGEDNDTVRAFAAEALGIASRFLPAATRTQEVGQGFLFAPLEDLLDAGVYDGGQDWQMDEGRLRALSALLLHNTERYAHLHAHVLSCSIIHSDIPSYTRRLAV